jgi:hypothetical protein
MPSHVSPIFAADALGNVMNADPSERVSAKKAGQKIVLIWSSHVLVRWSVGESLTALDIYKYNYK